MYSSSKYLDLLDMYICSAFLLIDLKVNFKAHKFDTQDPEDPGEKHPSPMNPNDSNVFCLKIFPGIGGVHLPEELGWVDGIRMG